MTSNLEADIRTTVRAQLEAARRGDADAFADHFHQEVDMYWFDGRPLIQAPESLVALRGPLDRGSKMDLRFDDLRIRIFASSVAVLTGNLQGTVRRPDGKEFDMGFRMTIIRIKGDDDWKIVHWHESPMGSDTGKE